MNIQSREIIGNKFGTLTAIRPTGEKDNRGKNLWLARCDCGNEVTRPTAELKRASCCGQKCPFRPIGNKTHNLSASPTYFTWKGMIQRCTNLKDPSYQRYGGAGIKVCQRWLLFENFLSDMGERPEGTTLDRKNSKGNYEPSNCRWATQAEQATNKRSNKRYEFQGERLTIPEWAKLYRMNEATLQARVGRHGWTIEKALTAPIKPRGARSWQPSV